MKRYLALLFLFSNPVLANSINTTSNSTGSVVNQAVQVVPSRQFQYQMNTISCQGATLNISPFISTTYGFDGILYIQKDGRMDYQQGQDIIDQVGKSVKVTGPSDDVPRYRLKK